MLKFIIFFLTITITITIVIFNIAYYINKKTTIDHYSQIYHKLIFLPQLNKKINYICSAMHSAWFYYKPHRLLSVYKII
jgi:hypothetical protein